VFLNRKSRSLLLLVGLVGLVGAITVPVAAELIARKGIHETTPEPSFINRVQKGDRLMPVRSEPRETRYV
jgi:hypothetical protein